MRINRKLNIVFPVDTEEHGTIHVHSTPISREVFERHFLVISKTFAALYAEGLTVLAGPRVAAMMLRRVAENTARGDGSNEWNAVDGIERALMPEMRRLTNVLIPTPAGYEVLPYQEVVSRKMLDPDDVSEVEGVLAFFTVASSMHRADALVGILAGLNSLWAVQTTSQSCTEYRDSLLTSTQEESTGEMEEITSSLPS